MGVIYQNKEKCTSETTCGIFLYLEKEKLLIIDNHPKQ
jgi:hypothetical protein